MPISRDVARIEAFSDAVFGFALTLLVVSLEVPRTFGDMMNSVRALPAFAASFAILLLIWQEHHNFFRRYGVHDGLTIWINGVLLFVVLFYVYPLKFLMTMLIGPRGVMFGGRPDGVSDAQMPQLMLMYGAGFVALFLLIAALHWHALSRLRQEPEPGVNLYELRLHLGACFVYVTIGVLSMAIATYTPWRWAPAAAGFAYAFIGPAHYVYYNVIAPRVIKADPVS
ncbi:MAG TPA: TMEM175 family protein [Luteitalea sp.]|nr:TMEM175 family protein [Luteitalea sp.]